MLGKSVKEAVEWALQPGNLDPDVAAVVAAAKEQAGMNFVGEWRCHGAAITLPATCSCYRHRCGAGRGR